ncbi:MAG: MBL fold metallo-hydrolase [Proteobacteria bacterium]|nr:MBL fold metallo-hydrolase [Pseudomonadota bacterium]
MIPESALRRVTDHIWYFDSRQAGALVVSGLYIIAGDGLTLVETGTSLVAPGLLEAVDRIGFKEKDLKRIVLTHIHLDHGGATGWLVQRLPHLRVFVHERGARHIVDPSVLLESAKVLYGTLEAIEEVHGRILPVPAGNVTPVLDSEIDLGRGIRLRTFDAPGHAPHHLGSYEPDSGCVFTGEALGHYYPEWDLIGPAVAPPSFDYEVSRETIRKIGDLRPRTICFSQYGPHARPAEAIQAALDRLDSDFQRVKACFEQGLDSEGVIAEMEREYLTGRDASARQALVMLRSMVLGYEFYFRRRGLLD